VHLTLVCKPPKKLLHQLLSVPYGNLADRRLPITKRWQIDSTAHNGLKPSMRNSKHSKGTRPGSSLIYHQGENPSNPNGYSKSSASRTVVSRGSKPVSLHKGFSQRYGVDYEETYAPTVSYGSLRMLLAIAAMEDLEIHQMDVDNAYLATELEEEIYMCPPPGYETDGKFCRLRKRLYGLKQAARAWHKPLSGYLESIASRNCQTTHAS
jgi:hypothetical protein